MISAHSLLFIFSPKFRSKIASRNMKYMMCAQKDAFAEFKDEMSEEGTEKLKELSAWKGEIDLPYVSTVSKSVRNNLFDEERDTNSQELIKIRCPYCKTLNDEKAKYCQECGKLL